MTTEPGAGTAPGGEPVPGGSERCAEERRIADERCELATRARAQADAAVAALRQAQRSYDEHEAAAVTASWRGGPQGMHAGQGNAPAAPPSGGDAGRGDVA